MGNETSNPAASRSLHTRASIDAYQGAEAVDISSTDASPTLEDEDGNSLTPRALYVGVSGDVVVKMADGTDNITIKSAPVGVLAVAVSKVYKLSTTATNLLFLY